MLGRIGGRSKRLLDEGIAQRMSDIDAVYVNRYGFPRERGGPMYYAIELGLERLDAQLRVFSMDTTLPREFWLP